MRAKAGAAHRPRCVRRRWWCGALLRRLSALPHLTTSLAPASPRLAHALPVNSIPRQAAPGRAGAPSGPPSGHGWERQAPDGDEHVKRLVARQQAGQPVASGPGFHPVPSLRRQAWRPAGHPGRALRRQAAVESTQSGIPNADTPSCCDRISVSLQTLLLRRPYLRSRVAHPEHHSDGFNAP